MVVVGVVVSFNLLISNDIFIAEPGGPRRVSLALVLLVFGKIMSFNAHKAMAAQTWLFVVVAAWQADFGFLVVFFFAFSQI